MAVIVNDGMSIDLALRMLWREANRELVIDKLKENRYYIKPTAKKHEIQRVFEKRKAGRRKRHRRMKQRGWV
jgi:ribosomal protein S21